MEIIAKDAFNRDLDEYIKRTKARSRGEKSGFDLKFSFSNNKPSVKPYHEDNSGMFSMFSKKPKKEENLTAIKQQIEVTGEELEELKEEEHVLEEKRESMIGKLFNSIFGTKQELPDQVEVVDLPKEEPKPTIDPDIIEVLKISAKWINKLDPDLKQDFRDSPDYAKYKYLVDRINSKR